MIKAQTLKKVIENNPNSKCLSGKNHMYVCQKCGLRSESTKQYAMHPIQGKLLDILDGKEYSDSTLRSLGKEIGEGNSPQKIKHHLNQLVKYGYLNIISGKYRKELL